VGRPTGLAGIATAVALALVHLWLLFLVAGRHDAERGHEGRGGLRLQPSRYGMVRGAEKAQQGTFVATSTGQLQVVAMCSGTVDNVRVSSTSRS